MSVNRVFGEPAVDVNEKAFELALEHEKRHVVDREHQKYAPTGTLDDVKDRYIETIGNCYLKSLPVPMERAFLRIEHGVN